MGRTYVYAAALNRQGRLSGGSAGKESSGIYCFVLDTQNGKLSFAHFTKLQDTGNLVISPDGRFVYAAIESRDFPDGLPGSGGGIAAFRADPSDGSLRLLNTSCSYGSRTCYLSLTKTGKFLLAANHGSHSAAVCRYEKDAEGNWHLQRLLDDSSVAVFAIAQDGSIGSLTDLRQFTSHGYYTDGGGQSTSHIHCVQIHDTNFVAAANRGGDRLETFRLNTENGQLENDQSCAGKAGLAPRHLVYHPSLPVFYVCHENFPCVTTWRMDAVKNRIAEIQRMDTMPPAYMEKHPNRFPDAEQPFENKPPKCIVLPSEVLPADIHVHPSGRYLYVSNRTKDGSAGSIAVFSICKENGLASFLGIRPVPDCNPRGFAISPDGNYAVVCLMQTGKLAVYPIDPESGMLQEASDHASVPICCNVRIVSRP